MGTGWATLGDRVGHPCRSHHACPRAPLQPAPVPPKKPRGAIRHAPRPRCPGDRMAAATSRGLQRGWRGAGGTRPTPVARWSTGGVLLRSALPLPSCLSPARAADGTKLGPAGATACHRLVAPVPSTATRSQPGGIPPPSPPRSLTPLLWFLSRPFPSHPVPTLLTASPPSPPQRCWGGGCATRPARRTASARRRGRAPRWPRRTPQVGEHRQHPHPQILSLPLRPSPNPRCHPGHGPVVPSRARSPVRCRCSAPVPVQRRCTAPWRRGAGSSSSN